MHLDDVRFGWSENEGASMTRAFQCSEKAIELDPELADAYAVLCAAHRIEKDWDRAIEAGEKATALGPNSAEVHMVLAQSMMYAARPADGHRLIQIARRLSPIPADVDYVPLGLGYMMTDRVQEGLDAFQRSRALHENLMGAICSAWAAIELDDQQAARDAAEAVLRIDPGFSLKRADRFLTFKSKEVTARLLHGLRKAGLPE
jgi:tetratricopeptide (TPR) repeat protein